MKDKKQAKSRRSPNFSGGFLTILRHIAVESDFGKSPIDVFDISRSDVRLLGDKQKAAAVERMLKEGHLERRNDSSMMNVTPKGVKLARTLNASQIDILHMIQNHTNKHGRSPNAKQVAEYHTVYAGTLERLQRLRYIRINGVVHGGVRFVKDLSNTDLGDKFEVFRMILSFIKEKEKTTGQLVTTTMVSEYLGININTSRNLVQKLSTMGRVVRDNYPNDWLTVIEMPE